MLRASGPCKIYQAGDVAMPALRGVDLGLMRGALVVLVGPSGSGRRMRLDMLRGLQVASAGALLHNDGKLVLRTIARVDARLGSPLGVISHNAAIGAMADRMLTQADGRIVHEVVTTAGRNRRTEGMTRCRLWTACRCATCTRCGARR